MDMWGDVPVEDDDRMARLLFFRGQELLIEYRLRPGRTSIGRADSADVALPGEEVSRTHCLIDGRGEGWELVDRSRHGTTLDGQRVKRGALTDGSRIGVGPYTVEVRLRESGDQPGPTAEATPDGAHELVLATDDALRVERARITVVEGPGAGETFILRQSRVTMGAPPSRIGLRDLGLVADHVVLRVARGRVMIEPGAGAAYVEGERVRDITPLHAGEEFRVGQTVLRVETGQDEEVPMAPGFGDMVGRSTTMQKLFGMLRRMAAHHFPVLVTGESGTGKELAARGIHEHSARAPGPFVPINCGAIPENLFESELFGHERGAFTGASRRADGAFHRADGGTLFLDEVGELPEPAQAKLLRALESGEVRRVGANEATWPDVRIVAATNRDLASEVQRGTFREDLFFRLAVLSVHIPPLREHMGDLEVLATSLVRALHPEATLSTEALAELSRHDWPGNVRELRNVLTRAYVLGGPLIGPETISYHRLERVAARPAPMTADEAERAYLLSVLQRNDDNRSAAARELGIARSTLHHKLKRLGLG